MWVIAGLTGAAMLPASPARAQNAWQNRAVVSLNAGFQAASNDFNRTGTFEEFVETAMFDAGYDVEPTALVDAGVAIRLWRNLGAGVAVSWHSQETSATVDARIPHPFFFNRFRAVSGEAGGIDRSETAVHAQIVYGLPLTDRLFVLVSGGPSYFDLEQDLIARVAFTHEFPFDTATFDEAVLASEVQRGAPGSAPSTSESGIGFNAGADVTWSFARTIGVGFGLRFSRAELDFDQGDQSTSIDAGGIHLVAGLRVLF
jgi:opacity protein-like surface antigen